MDSRRPIAAPKNGIGLTSGPRYPSRNCTSTDIARERKLDHLPDGGRRELGKEAARQIPTIRQKCREDFDNLAQRIEKVTTTG